jgi:hypothetical protein
VTTNEAEVKAETRAMDAAVQAAVLDAVDGLWRTDVYLTPDEAATVARAAVDAVVVFQFRARARVVKRRWWKR